MVTEESESRWERGLRWGAEYWHDAVWPGLKFAIPAALLVMVVLMLLAGE